MLLVDMPHAMHAGQHLWNKLMMRMQGEQPQKQRRKNQRWSAEETAELIALMRVHGRGKWKVIVDHATTFKNRTQVVRLSACLGWTTAY